MTPAPAEVRRYEAQARTTDTFGRVLTSVRNHHTIVDGPVQNGCPGEEVTPAELFLSGVAACGVELLQVIARSQQVPLSSVRVAIEGTIDPANPVRPDVSLFNSVKLRFALAGVDQAQAQQLVDAFRRR
jgi:uncharacterized OsmC-like protein